MYFPCPYGKRGFQTCKGTERRNLVIQVPYVNLGLLRPGVESSFMCKVTQPLCYARERVANTKGQLKMRRELLHFVAANVKSPDSLLDITYRQQVRTVRSWLALSGGWENGTA